MALVEPPVPADRQPGPPELVERELGGADGPGQHRGVEHPEVEVRLGREQPARRSGLGLALGREVDVEPSR